MLQLAIEVDALPVPDGPALRKVSASALKIWNGYFRRRIEARFQAEGPGWAPRKAVDDASAAAREHSATSLAEHRMKRKLERDLRRARTRLERGKGKVESVIARAQVLKEFERQVAGGGVGAGTVLKQGSKEQAIAALTGGMLGSKRMQKSVAKLAERFARVERTVSGRVLGRVSRSIGSKVGRGVLDVFSRIPWSDVQNVGGQVGHGATLPARPFMYITSEDVDILVEIVLNLIATAFGAS